MVLLCVILTVGFCQTVFANEQAFARVDALYDSVIAQEGQFYVQKDEVAYRRDVEELIEHYRNVMDVDDKNPEVHYRLARLYMVLNTVNDRQRAKRALNKAIRLEPDNVDYQLTLGKLLWSQMFWYNGNAHYEDLTETFPQESRALAKAQYWMGFYALQGFLAYRDRLVMGHEEFAEADRVKAIDLFKRSIEADPDLRDPYYHLGLLYLETGQPDSLIFYARRLTQRYPEDAHAFLFCGLGYQTLGQEALAYEYYTTALNMFSDAEREMMASVAYLTSEEERVVEEVSRDRFWKKKDPLLLSHFNESRMDHYRRVAYANLRFSRLLRGIPGWQTDKGKTHIRFGPYLSRSVYERRETWYYDDFRIHFRSGADLDAWYFDGEEVGEALASLAEGYWPDHGRAHFEKQPPNFYDPYHNQKYSMPHQVVAFPVGDSVRLEVAYAIPVEKVNIANDVQIENGLFLFDAQWDSIYADVKKQNVFELNTQKTPEGLFWITQHTVILPNMVCDIVAEVGDYKYASVGTFRLKKEKAQIDSVLSLSEVLLASRIDLEKPFPEVREDVQIVQNPLKTYRQSDFLRLYFEVYHLEQDAFGRSPYTVSYRVGWPEQEDVDPALFLAIEKVDTQLVVQESKLAAEGKRNYQVRYVIPEQKQVIRVADQEKTETEIAVEYEGDREQAIVFLNVDLNDVPVGVHQIQVQVSQKEKRAVQAVLFRVVE